MSDSVDSVLHAALRGLSLRQQVIADNIANSDTPGFHARVVRFEDRLQQIMADDSRGGGTSPSEVLSEAAPTVEEAVGRQAKVDGNTVDMDQELVGMTDTTMRYNAVARIMTDRLALYRSVITDGRG